MTGPVPEVGAVVAERDFHLTRESLVRYAGASGDFNQIHWSDRVADAVGLPGVIAQGMLTMGLAVQPVVDWLAALGPGARILEYGTRFSRMVVVDPVAGADVHVVAKVGAVDAGTARIDLTVTHAEQTVLAKAQVTVRLPPA
jgi:acyl dehydratase